jgi:predicted HicB family RNase H-like nuclease
MKTPNRIQKRKITPYKGGRTATLFVRIRPKVKDKLEQLCKKEGISIADWIEKKIIEEE